MKGAELKIGPVLSFRGLGEDGRWKVTALIGVEGAAAAPRLVLDEVSCGEPVELAAVGGLKMLRYDFSVRLSGSERRVSYAIEGMDLKWSFTVPAEGDAPRAAYVSCNGFSDPNRVRKLKLDINAVWRDLLCNHDRQMRPTKPGAYTLDREQLWHEEAIHDHGVQRFHLLLMGGDQIYFDSIWEELPVLKRWVQLSREQQLGFKVSKALDRQIERYYFGLYPKRWLDEKRGAWSSASCSLDAATAMASIPTIMMWDDHDIIDGWGSYSAEMQRCPLFKVIFKHARRAFWVFQMQQRLEHLPELEPHPARGAAAPGAPQFKGVLWSEVLKGDTMALPLLDGQPGFSSAFRMGSMALLVADLRTERSGTQILGLDSWAVIGKWSRTLAADGDAVSHLMVMSSVPVIHPKMTLAEEALEVFGSDHVQDSSADDLKDHWSHDDHEAERKQLLEMLMSAAKRGNFAGYLLSGDVHVAAWGLATRTDIASDERWARVYQFTSSAIVHPSLVGVHERLFLWWLNRAAGKPQQIDTALRAEMVLFPGHNRHLMAARNWLALEVWGAAAGPKPAKLWATWRCEGEVGFSSHTQAV